MPLRELTTDERTKLDTAWQAYLNAANVEGTAQECEAWTAYKQTMHDMRIVITLGGYRIRDIG